MSDMNTIRAPRPEDPENPPPLIPPDVPPSPPESPINPPPPIPDDVPPPSPAYSEIQPVRPPEPPAPLPPAKPAGGHRNTWIIVIIILVVLCCCCVVIGGVGYYLYQNGDQIMQNMQPTPNSTLMFFLG
jgi:hypothetical protein